MNEYRLISDVTADVSESLMEGVAPVTFLPMPVKIGEQEYLYGTPGSLSIQSFYEKQRGGLFATTAQITPTAYIDAFSPILANGEDILALCFTSGLSGTWQSLQLAAADLRERYPERELICIDTLCAAVGEGFLVREAARMKQQGMGIHELAAWVEERRDYVCHWFTVDGFTHLKHGGRVSSAAAAVGSVLNIKPLLHVNKKEGKLEVIQKPRGAKAAMAAQLAHMREGWNPDLGRLVIIGHGDCTDKAEVLGAKVKEEFLEAEIHYAYIGPVIGAHTGPGMLALIYWGRNK